MGSSERRRDRVSHDQDHTLQGEERFPGTALPGRPRPSISQGQERNISLPPTLDERYHTLQVWPPILHTVSKADGGCILLAHSIIIEWLVFHACVCTQGQTNRSSTLGVFSQLLSFLIVC